MTRRVSGMSNDHLRKLLIMLLLAGHGGIALAQVPAATVTGPIPAVQPGDL